MPVTVVEAHQSRKIGPDWREYAYLVTGTGDETTAMNAAAAQRALYITILNPNRKTSADPVTIRLRQRVTASQEIDGADVNRHTWFAIMRYEPEEEPLAADDSAESRSASDSLRAYKLLEAKLAVQFSKIKKNSE